MTSGKGLQPDLARVFDRQRIGEMQSAFQRRLRHSVVFMDRNAEVLVDETGSIPRRQGQRPHPCEHCAHILHDDAAGASLCHGSDVEGARIAGSLRKPLLYKCWSSKSNVAIPITVGGLDIIGNLYAGQFFAVVDGEDERLAAERLCEEKGFVIHDGRGLDGRPTVSIHAGFFWSRDDIEAWDDRQQDFHRRARVQASLAQFQKSWRAVPRIPYQEAIASVELLTSVANTFATEAYEKLVYRLHNDIRRTIDKYVATRRALFITLEHWVKAADTVVSRMGGQTQGAAETAERLAQIYTEVLEYCLNWKMDRVSASMDRRTAVLDLTGNAAPLEPLKINLRLFREEVSALARTT